MIPLVTEPESEQARKAAQAVVEMHWRLVDFLRVGQTLAEIDTFVARSLGELGCRSAFLGYKTAGSPAFPGHACLSLNSCVVHGAAGHHREPIGPGDILKIDIGVVREGWIGDAAMTYAIRERSDEAARLMACGREALRRGVLELRPGNTFRDWARVVERYVEREQGFHLVRGLGGHGYGRKLHGRPYVSNNLPTSPGEWADADTPCTPGTLVAVEPMIAVGTPEIVQHRVGRFGPLDWPIYTADGSLSVHYEHDVLITEDGPDVLTAGLEELPDVVAGG